jgi:plasmid stabilization system protein ParE
MAKIIISSRARTDLRAINAYIGERGGRVVAGRFIDQIETAIHALGILPFGYVAQPQFGSNIRRMVYKPYLIFYRAGKDSVDVLRVLHGARLITKTMIEE